MPRKKEQTEQMRAESREKILATAQHLFAERGFDGCNISDIAQQAGMSQGNIYWYFSSKKEIYKAVLVEGFQCLGAVMAESAEQQGSAVEKLDSFLKGFVALMKDQGGEDFLTIIITMMAQGGVQRLSEFGLSTNAIGAGYHQSLNAIFAQGQTEGSFPKDIDPDLLSTFLFSYLNGLMLMYPDTWKDIPDEIIRQSVHRLLGMNNR